MSNATQAANTTIAQTNAKLTSKDYNASAKGLMRWACHELQHVGKIIALKDPDLQVSYAMSTVNGMAHLKDALYQTVKRMEKDGTPAYMKDDLLRVHENVIRVAKHLVKDFNLGDAGKAAMKAFNIKGTLSSSVLDELFSGGGVNTRKRKQRKANRRSTRRCD
jgi:hypothetical protein